MSQPATWVAAGLAVIAPAFLSPTLAAAPPSAPIPAWAAKLWPAAGAPLCLKGTSAATADIAQVRLFLQRSDKAGRGDALLSGRIELTDATGAPAGRIEPDDDNTGWAECDSDGRALTCRAQAGGGTARFWIEPAGQGHALVWDHYPSRHGAPMRLPTASAARMALSPVPASTCGDLGQ